MLVAKHFGLLISVIIWKSYMNCATGYEKDLRSNKHYLEGNRKVILSVGELAWAT